MAPAKPRRLVQWSRPKCGAQRPRLELGRWSDGDLHRHDRRASSPAPAAGGLRSKSARGTLGGRLLWQLAGNDEFTVAWMLDLDPRARATELIRAFVAEFGSLPFANLTG